MPDNRQDTSSKIGFFRSLYLKKRFFIALIVCVVGFFVSFSLESLLFFVEAALGVFVVLVLVDILSLYSIKHGFEAIRHCPDRLSNGDQNPISITIKNLYSFPASIMLVEEVPYQFQKRDLIFHTNLSSGKSQNLYYELRPTKRGIYKFGHINVFVSGILGLVARRYMCDKEKDVAVYPAFLEMRKYELLAASHRLTDYGIKRIRRIGHASDFDQIKHYVPGDDPRTINYKATARVNQLMANTYEDEKAQPVYCLIDKGRTMKMPFNGMTLLDYAINSALMVASTALNKGDKVGLITFSKKIDDIVPADKNRRHRNVILEALYAQKTDFKESDFERLYIAVRRKITQRSLIILYTNFETVNSIRRQMKYLSSLTREHLVLVAFFANSEFSNILNSYPEEIEDAFKKGMAEKLSNDKALIVKELNRNGIYTILSKPENLTIDSINKYLEFKSRGLI